LTLPAVAKAMAGAASSHTEFSECPEWSEAQMKEANEVKVFIFDYI